jgi:hypothetical protein
MAACNLFACEGPGAGHPTTARRCFLKSFNYFATLLLLCAALLVSSQPVRADFMQQGEKLFGSGAVGAAQQGGSVAVSADGNTAIVGGLGDNNNAGAAWVWIRSGGVWTQQGGKLVGAGAVGGVLGQAQQGRSVALSADGNTAIVGGVADNNGAGAAWVWTRSGGVWTQQGAKLVGSGAVGQALLGQSAALSADGNTAIVSGSNDNNGAGAAWVYTRSSGVWTQQGGKLLGTGAVAAARQGFSVALSSDGNTAIVGGDKDNSDTGAAWVYTRSSGVWTQQGNKLVDTEAVGAAQQGQSVSLSDDGNTAIVGGSKDNSDTGAAWVWTRSSGVWTRQGNKLVGSGAVGAAQQGQSVSLSDDGNTAIVGGSKDNSRDGAAWGNTRSGGVWTQQGNKLVGTGANGDAFQGGSVALSADGNTAIVGGIGDNGGAGAVWVFTQPPTVTGVSPSSGATLGGTAVTITGTRFTGATGVTFGGVAATNVTVVDPNTITATTPAHAAGAVNVVVASERGSGTGAYTYLKTSTTTSLGSSPRPSKIDQLVTFTATVTGSGATGTVTFKDGTDTLDVVAVTSNTAAYSTSTLSVGRHTISAIYNGDGIYFGSTSPDLIQTVKGATTTAVVSNHDPSKFGQLVTFTATVAAVAPAAGVPTGTATFKRGATTLGTSALSGGSATLQTGALAVGNHPITAVYGGNANFTRSTSRVLTQNVTKGATKTVLTSSPKPSMPGNPVKLTATVTAVAPAQGTRTGNVTFKNGANALGTKALVAGEATLQTSALPAGNNKLTATYAGSGTFNPSTSPVLNHPVRSSGLAVAKLTDGGFVAALETKDKDGRSSIQLRRYPADERVAAKDLPGTAVSHDRSQPSVAGLENGGFVVVWTSDGQDGDRFGIHGQRYSAAGGKFGSEFQVNMSTRNDQSQPSVAAVSDGGFVVAWASNQQAGAGSDIYAQRYTAAGKAVGGELRVTDAANDQTQPSVAALKGGGFVVAWQSVESDSDISGQRYDAAGRKVGAEFRVNTVTAKDQMDPSVAGLNDGGFIVAWTSDGGDEARLGVSAQRFDSAGKAVGGELKVTKAAAGDRWQPAVAAFADGGFALVWNSQEKNTAGVDVRGQAYDTAGKPIQGEFAVNAIRSNELPQPRVAAFSGGNVVVLWTAPDEKTALQGVREQRFNTTRADKEAASR